MKKIVFNNFELLSHAATQAFIFKCNEVLLHKKFFKVALSGGNTPKRMYELLASSEYSRNIDWSKVKIAIVDERHVPLDNENSNYKMIYETLLSQVPIKKSNIVFPTFDKDIDQSVKKYQTTLQKVFKSSWPKFNLMILGLGKDGHTASLFPKNDALKIKNKPVTQVYLPGQLNRISFTFPLIKKADLLLFLISGADKKAALEGIFNKNLSLPAALVTENAIAYCDLASI